MTRLQRAQLVISDNYDSANCGIFNNRNDFGDTLYTLYDDGDLRIDICYMYSYFEVFGLTNEEFYELYKYYNTLAEIKKIYEKLS